MRKRWMIAVAAPIGCAAVALGAVTALLKHFGLNVERDALQECVRMIHSSSRADTVDAPTVRRDGQYELLIWHRYKSHVPHESDALVEKPIMCKFDLERGQVTYIGFD